MSAKKNSGPAFPDSIAVTESGRAFYGSRGMTLRQWYAGMAMQGFLSVPQNQGESDEVIAKWAFSQADAMLEHEAREAAK